MKPKSLIALCITVFCAVCTAVSQNPQMVGGVDPNTSNNPMPPLDANGIVTDAISATEMGSALYFGMQDNVLRKISLNDVISSVVTVGAPAQGQGSLSLLSQCNGKLYFSGPRVTDWYTSPWVSNGTTSGTLLLYSQNSPTNPAAFTAVGSKVFFKGVEASTGANTSGTDKHVLFVTDGTTRGTKKVITNFEAFDAHAGIFAINSEAFFFARLGTKAGLWKSNGSSKGTVFIKSTVVDPLASLLPSYTWRFPAIKPVLINNKLYYPAVSAEHGAELWVSDGTTSGTYVLKDINPGPAGSFPAEFAATTDYLYFAADNGTSGREVFRLKFSTGAVELVADVETGIASSEPINLTAAGTVILFTAKTVSYGHDVYAYHEATGELVHLDINDLGSDVPDRPFWKPFFVSLNGWTYFRGYEPAIGLELFRTNGTYTGTELVKDIYPGANGSQPHNFIAFNNKLYFRAHDGTHGREWWVLDPMRAFSKPSVANGETFDLALMNCDPNPFEGTTTITYSVPTSMSVRIDIIDMFGHVAATLTDAEQSAGVHSVAFDGRPFASGTFFCRLTAGSEQRTMKIVNLK